MFIWFVFGYLHSTLMHSNLRFNPSDICGGRHDVNLNLDNSKSRLSDELSTKTKLIQLSR